MKSKRLHVEFEEIIGPEVHNSTESEQSHSNVVLRDHRYSKTSTESDNR